MATLDRYLEAMVKHRADALVFRADALIEMVQAGQTKPVSSRPATEDQIVALLAEVLGPSYTPGAQGVRSFPYRSPMGPVTITVEDGMNGLRVRIAAGAGLQPGTAPDLPRSSPGSIAIGDLGGPSRDVPPRDLPSRDAPSRDASSRDAPFRSTTPVPVTVPAPSHAPTGTQRAPMPAAPVEMRMPSSLDDLFHQMLDMKASDIHLKSNSVPQVRVDGSIMPMPGRPVISAGLLEQMLDTILPERNRDEFQATNDTDFAHEVPGRARMRCNYFRDIVGIGAVFRQIPSKILTAEDLRLPKAVLDLCTYDKGLVVVTGPTGSGKSTTLAAMIDWINTNRDDHIITIEDPVEFVHKDKKCLINQREVGTQTKSFKAALRAALREDPDIVLVGEMRDLETVAIAIETAETGHLVFGTLHTNTAPSTVDRLIDQFPTDRQAQIRIMLSESLKGVVAQTLLKKKSGGRVAALEILIVTPAIANLIREGKTYQIPSMMQTGRGLGMQMLSDALFDLVKNDIVAPDEAYDRAPHKKEFGAMLTRGGFRGPWSVEKDVG